MKLEPRDRVLVVGVTGSGKTYWTKRLARTLPRVVAWDVHGEYADDAGLVRVDSVDALGLAFDVDDERAPLRVAVVPQWDDPTDLHEEFRAFSRLIRTSRNLACIVDEVGLLSMDGAGSGGAMGAVVMLATQSRHWGVPLVLVAQRATQVARTARDQARHIRAFMQTAPADLAALEEIVGPLAQRLPTFDTGRHLAWSQGGAARIET